MALSPALHPLLAHLLTMDARQPAGSQSPEEARASMKRRVAPLLSAFEPKCAIRDFNVPGPGGDLPVRLLTPQDDAEGLRPVIVFFHGGGWVVCDNETHTPLADALAAASGAAVLMVDYALAPELPFPAAIKDGLAALDWVVASGADQGLDCTRMALAGDSAGGNLAAVLARRCRDRSTPDIRAQYLIYPVIDLPDPSRYPSYDACADYGLTASDMAWYWSLYAGSAAAGIDLLPLRADLHGLPPALVHTAAFDVLRDEGQAYAAAMAGAGVSVSAKVWPGMIHGFLSLIGPLDVAEVAAAEAGIWLRARLA